MLIRSCLCRCSSIAQVARALPPNMELFLASLSLRSDSSADITTRVPVSFVTWQVVAVGLINHKVVLFLHSVHMSSCRLIVEVFALSLSKSPFHPMHFWTDPVAIRNKLPHGCHIFLDRVNLPLPEGEPLMFTGPQRDGWVHGIHAAYGTSFCIEPSFMRLSC